MNNSFSFLPASKSHLMELLALEARCFTHDRLSKRSFKHWLKHENSIFLVAVLNETIVGYGLVLNQRGTSLARLYSLAVLPEHQGKGLAIQLLTRLEQQSYQAGRIHMRLEVAKRNGKAINLYKRLGYREFGELHDYYEDHDDALRMQKNIWQGNTAVPKRQLQWVMQTTDFTCGPASLMMAMTHAQPSRVTSIEEELDIWRSATTIFMTSGHGGTHPIGLALAAGQRGFSATVKVNTDQPLFIEGVRTDHKKEIMTRVHNHFLAQANSQNISIDYSAPSLDWIAQEMTKNATILVLISTYQLDKRKAPHWVAVTHIDDNFIYVHDPDVGEHQTLVDCQHVPIARASFDSMSAFGKGKLRTAIAIFPSN